MATRRNKALTALVAFFAFSCAQVYVKAGLPNPPAGGAPQRFIARLTTTGGSATVNGNNAASGATILTGATIETPDQVSATIDLGGLGTVELQPGSKIQLDFADDGTVRVKILRGCVRIKKKGPGEAEAYTAEGSSEKSNSNRKSMGFCYANGSLNPYTVPTGATGAGLSAGAKAGIAAAAIGGGITAAVLIARGGNNSPH